MVTENIFRTPTDIERAEMKIIGDKDLTYHFRKKNVAKETEYTKAHKPYCFRCAKIDFEKNVSDAVREKQLNVNEEKEIDVDRIYKIDLDTYGAPKRFKLVRTEEVFEDKLIDGIRNSVQTGYNISYECSERGCKHCVFVPLKVYNEREHPKSSSNTTTK